ncbi:hypothetical protein N7445_010151 [Penicillium cf. griseofulvum]|nr:hypothetical protein N7445_010151 [Penicillium cf. griseofulvum]
MDSALPGGNNIQDIQPAIGVVRTYNQWLAALAAMQTSHLMGEMSIEYVLRDGLVTSSASHRVPPVAAAQFFIVRTASFVSDDYILEVEDPKSEMTTVAKFRIEATPAVLTEMEVSNQENIQWRRRYKRTDVGEQRSRT